MHVLNAPTVFRYALAAITLIAAIYSAVLAIASHLFQEDTPYSVAAAVALVPNNSAYLTRLAAWDGSRRTTLLERAVRANKFDDAAWLRLALDAEMQRHNLPEAERDFLQAVHYDHTFLPKWTLTNFYFRHGEKEKLLRASEATLAITPYPADPIFSNMWLYEPDAKQLSNYIPDRPGILAQYVIFLGASRQYDALPPVVARLVKAGAENPAGWGLNDIIGPTEDRLLYSGFGNVAQEIWRTLVKGHWLDFGVVDQARPLTNGDFHLAFWGHGFDWLLPPSTGLTVLQETDVPEVRFTLDGNQEDHVTFIQQWLPLAAGHAYRLEWLASSENLHQPSGLTWAIQAGAVQLLSGEALPEKEQPRWDFAVPAGAPSVSLLSLQYQRPLGEMRANGTVSLRAVKLTER